ncbi:DUF4998 domain-containing protein, partial [Bacteroides thetaiotaomicron]|uniref:DUF4998 domain-containing protein n=1 Tax=Bacteroides thetaiotaomicron TaxID=818 RepID=UPI00232EDD66
MKQFIKHTPYLVSLLILLGITSCTKMDEYLKYTDGKEILYTGIPDSIAMYSGYNRVVFRGVLASDPKIAKIKIYLKSATLLKSQSVAAQTAKNAIFLVW